MLCLGLCPFMCPLALCFGAPRAAPTLPRRPKQSRIPIAFELGWLHPTSHGHRNLGPSGQSNAHLGLWVPSARTTMSSRKFASGASKPYRKPEERGLEVRGPDGQDPSG